jgi:hypothetical protein
MLQVYFDRFAITLSSICAIHCIALPVVASLIPLLATSIPHDNALHEFWFHQFILIFILPVSIFALIAGYRCHKKITPIFVGTIGLVILAVMALFAENLVSQQIISSLSETILTIFGGIIHAAGHISNVLTTKTHRASCAME